MAVGSGIYITWITGAILISVAMMPIFKPPYAKVRIEGFIDMFRRYWAHMIVVFSVYLWKDILDGLDRILMANTQLDMTPYVMLSKEISCFGYRRDSGTIFWMLS